MDRYWLLTWTTYGSWLPGDPRGSVASVRNKSGPRIEHDQPGTPVEEAMPGLEAASRARLKGEPIYLNQEQAAVLLKQFQETAHYRTWELCGVAIMANHIHLVVGVMGDPDPEYLVGNFKSYGSRALNKIWGKPISETWWTGHGGSTRKLPNEAAVLAALEYLRNQANFLLIWIGDDETKGEPGA